MSGKNKFHSWEDEKTREAKKTQFDDKMKTTTTTTRATAKFYEKTECHKW